MNISDCLEQGLLVKIKPDPPKALASIEMAKHKLELAEKEIQAEIFENAIVTAYASMFHAARALLFKDGFKERSHFALFVFVNEKYSSKNRNGKKKSEINLNKRPNPNPHNKTNNK